MVQRLDDLGIVVAGVVDSRRNIVGVQIVFRIRLAQFLASVRVCGEPVGLSVLWEDDRHPVVDGVRQVVRLRRENRDARDCRTIGEKQPVLLPQLGYQPV